MLRPRSCLYASGGDRVCSRCCRMDGIETLGVTPPFGTIGRRGGFSRARCRAIDIEGQPDDLQIGSCIRAVEVNLEALQTCHERIEIVLLENGWSPDVVQQILDSWLLRGDFLSVSLESVFSHIVAPQGFLFLDHKRSEMRAFAEEGSAPTRSFFPGSHSS